MPGLVGHVLSDLPSSFMQAGDGYSGNYWGSIWYISVTPSGHKLSVCCLSIQLCPDKLFTTRTWPDFLYIYCACRSNAYIRRHTCRSATGRLNGDVQKNSIYRYI
jgi:hypothetical protein